MINRSCVKDIIDFIYPNLTSIAFEDKKNAEAAKTANNVLTNLIQCIERIDCTLRDAMKTVYGIMIQDQDRHTKHVPELYTSIEKARERRDSELKLIAEGKRLATNPILDVSHPMIAKLICGMFGNNMFSARIIEFLVPTDYQTCDATTT